MPDRFLLETLLSFKVDQQSLTAVSQAIAGLRRQLEGMREIEKALMQERRQAAAPPGAETAAVQPRLAEQMASLASATEQAQKRLAELEESYRRLQAAGGPGGMQQVQQAQTLQSNLQQLAETASRSAETTRGVALGTASDINRTFEALYGKLEGLFELQKVLLQSYGQLSTREQTPEIAEYKLGVLEQIDELARAIEETQRAIAELEARYQKVSETEGPVSAKQVQNVQQLQQSLEQLAQTAEQNAESLGQLSVEAAQTSQVLEKGVRLPDVNTERLDNLSEKLKESRQDVGGFSEEIKNLSEELESGAIDDAARKTETFADALKRLHESPIKINTSGLSEGARDIAEVNNLLQNLDDRMRAIGQASLAELDVLNTSLQRARRVLIDELTALDQQQQEYGESVEVLRVLNEEYSRYAEKLDRVNKALVEVNDVLLKTRDRERELAQQQRAAREGRIRTIREISAEAMYREATSESFAMWRTGMASLSVARFAGRIGIPIEQPAYMASDILWAASGVRSLAVEAKPLAARLVQMVGGFKVLVPVAAAATAALALYSKAMSNMKKYQEEARREVEATAAAYRKLAELMVVGGTQEARAALESAQRQRDILQVQREQLQAELQAAEREKDRYFIPYITPAAKIVRAVQSIFDESGKDALKAAERVDAFKRELKEIDKQTQKTEIAINVFTQALEDNALAAADAAAAYQKGLRQSVDQIVVVQELLQEAAIAAMTPGDPQELARRIKALDIQMDFSGTLVQKLHEWLDAWGDQADEATRAYVQQLIERAQQSNTAALIQKQVYQEVLLPVFEEASRKAQISSRAIEELNTRFSEMISASVRALSEADPAAVKNNMRALQLELELLAQKSLDTQRMFKEGIITEEDYQRAIEDTNASIRDVGTALQFLFQIVLPAAEKRAEELSQAYQMVSDATRQAQLAREAQTARDPELIENEISNLRNDLNIYTSALQNADAALSAGTITVEQHELVQKELQQSIDETTDKLEYFSTLLPKAVENARFDRLAENFNLYQQYLEEQQRVDEDRQRQLAREEEDYQRQRAKAFAGHYADLAELDARYNENVARELEKEAENREGSRKREINELARFQKDMQRLAEDHQRRMLDIQRDLNTGIEGAVEERSVSAAIEAIRAARERTEEEQEQYELQKKRRQEDFAERLNELKLETAERKKEFTKRLNDLHEQHRKERQARIAAFYQRLADEDADRALRRRRQEEDWQIEDERRKKHYQDVQGKYGEHFATMVTLTEQGMKDVETAIKNAWARISGSSLSTAPTTATGKSDVRPYPGYQMGGVVKSGQWVRVGESEMEYARFWPSGRWEIIPSGRNRRPGYPPEKKVTINMPVSVAVQEGDPLTIERTFETRILPRLVRSIENVLVV